MDTRGREQLSDRFLVYRTMEAGARDRHAQALLAQLQAQGPGRFLEPAFHHAASGAFRIFDHGRLWKNPSPDLLPPSAASARDVATRYLRAINRAAARHREAMALTAVEYPDPFPIAALRHVQTTPATSPRAEGQRDHWLSRWSCHLPVASPLTAEGKAPAPVIGAGVELRVGARGQVVGVVSYIRPWTAVFPRPALAPPGPPEGHREDDPPPVSLCYVMEAMTTPQRYLAPCWVRARAKDEGQAHHGPRTIFPATDLSLLIELAVEHGDEEATVRVHGLGGAGRVVPLEHGAAWRLSWRCAALDAFVRGGAETSQGSSLRLPGPGLYQVEVVVEDLARDNVQSTFAQIPVMARKGRPEREAPRV